MKLEENTFRRFSAEFMATFMLISVGCMGFAQASEKMLPSVNFGLVVVAVVHCFGIISGGHANPCITLACVKMGHLSSTDAAVYIAAQLLGGAAGYYLLTLLLPSAMVYDSTPGLCMPEADGSLSNTQLFFVEFFLTAVLVIVWIASWDLRNRFFKSAVALRIGTAVSALAIVGTPLSGASMNMVRSLVPPMFQNDYTNIHIYISAQTLGTMFATILWNYMLAPKCGSSQGNDSEESLHNN